MCRDCRSVGRQGDVADDLEYLRFAPSQECRERVTVSPGGGGKGNRERRKSV